MFVEQTSAHDFNRDAKIPIIERIKKEKKTQNKYFFYKKEENEWKFKNIFGIWI